MTHDLTKSLIAYRSRPDVGAFSPTGRRVSMLIEQIENGVSPAAIDQTRREIEQIQRDGGLYVHGHHGAGR